MKWNIYPKSTANTKKKREVYNHYVQLNISKTSDHMNKSKYL